MDEIREFRVFPAEDQFRRGEREFDLCEAGRGPIRGRFLSGLTASEVEDGVGAVAEGYCREGEVPEVWLADATGQAFTRIYPEGEAR